MGLILFLAAALAVQSSEVQVGTVAGKTEVGTLKQLSSEGVTLSTADGMLAVPPDQVLFITAQASVSTVGGSAEKPTAWLELVDGSKLHASQFTIRKGIAKLVSGDAVTLELPAKAIRKVRFSSPQDPQAATWPSDVEASATGDLLAVRKNGNVDFLAGVVGDVTADTVEFEFQGEKIPVKRTKVDGVIFFQKSTDQLPDPTCTVETAPGWSLKAKSVAMANGKLDITLLSGPIVQEAWDNIRRLDFSSGRVVYLSDLEPQSVQWTPFINFAAAPAGLSQYYSLRRDEGREHQPLRVDGTLYAKGLSLYSRTAITYRLPKDIKRFQAVAGIDDAVREGGVVRLEISADGKKLFDKTIDGAHAAVPLDLDVTGVRKLTILVDYGDDFDAGDYLNLGDARLLK